MIRRVLSAPLEPALLAAQASFTSSGQDEEWVIPAGEHTIAQGLQLGLPSRGLKIVGESGTRLRWAAGGLSLQGDDVTVSHMDIDAEAADASGGTGAALHIEAARAEVVSVHCAVTAGEATGIFVFATREAIVSHCRVSRVAATGGAFGMVLVAGELTVTSIDVTNVTGLACDAITLVSPGAANVLALDVNVADVEAMSGPCVGLSVRAGGRLSVRGVSARHLSGTFAHAVTLVGAGEFEASSIRVEDAVGVAGGAIGARLLANAPRSPVVVRDVFVESLGGAMPHSDARPFEEVFDWATETTRLLAEESAFLNLLPAFPAGEVTHEVVGVHIAALALASDGSWRETPQSLHAEDIVVHRVAGTAMQVEVGLRAAELRRIELWLCARAGWLQAENLLLAEATVHRHAAPLSFGPGNLRLFNSLFTDGVATPQLDAEAEIEDLRAVFVTGGAPPWQALSDLPYEDPGPELTADIVQGVVPLSAPVALGLRDVTLHAQAIVVDGEHGQTFVGARAPDVEVPCLLDDPEKRAWREPAPVWPDDPAVDYRARDAEGFLGVMLERARSTMVPWSPSDPSDLVQMMFELLAERLDHLSYRQERAVAEGFLETARLRRSVEDHVRPLDYVVDPGLSATTMLRFQVNTAALARAATSGAGSDLVAALGAGLPIEIPAGTLVGNTRPEERSIVFATQEVCVYLPELERIELAERIQVGAHRARFRGRFERLTRGRWLVVSRGAVLPGLVVRVTDVHLETDTTLVTWDPRRASAHAYGNDSAEEESTVVYGNVALAHHGLPVESSYQTGSDPSELDRALQSWRNLMRLKVDGRETREVQLPLRPSIQAAGYPFPDGRRLGRRSLTVAVEGDTWREIDDLSFAGPSDEVYVVRAGARGLPVLRFGDGVNGAALPARQVHIELEMSVGSGATGNVGAQTLTHLLRFGPSGAVRAEPERLISRGADPVHADLVRAIWTVTNPLPAVGGRDPEDLESIRYRAPFGVRDALSAVAPRDYERLLLRLPFVAGARARVSHAGPRELIQITVLLRDEDTLEEAELLRRWASVRRVLEDIRLLGFDVEAVPPRWVPLDIDLRVDAAPHAVQGRVRRDVIEAIRGDGGLLDPDSVGLGGDVHLSDVYEAIHAVEGVQSLRVLRFRRLEPNAAEHLGDGVIPIGADEVATVGGPRRPNAGLMTLTVCGGLS